jgi:DNA-directed RNA polymerase subunit RPC12/RpoP
MIRIFTKMIAFLTNGTICPKCGHLQSLPSTSKSNKIKCDQCGHMFLKEHYKDPSGFWEK